MNQPNVTVSVEELNKDKSLNHAEQFAKRAAEICGSRSSIVYTDFIADIGLIPYSKWELKQLDRYRGETNAPSRQESLFKWKSGQV